MATIQQLLSLVIAKGASDLHLVPLYSPILRVDGRLFPLPEIPAISGMEMTQLVCSVMNKEQQEFFLKNRELDFSFQFSDGNRFRINAYHSLGNVAAAFRLIPQTILEIQALSLPPIVQRIVAMRQGFVLVTGPTGHGKSTTLAAMLNAINQTRGEHILTIEDPVEYVLPKGKSVVSQRELGLDTHSWGMALRSALREDPDIVLIGEMRDHETIAAALTTAETGHLVFATLHTNSASQSIDRIVDAFPENQQGQVRMQLANTLAVVLSQRLLPRVDKGRILACEVLVGSSAVKNIIREGKTHMLDNVISTSKEMGMMLIDESLAGLVKSGTVATEVAREWSLRPEMFSRFLAVGEQRNT